MFNAEFTEIILNYHQILPLIYSSGYCKQVLFLWLVSLPLAGVDN